LAESVPLAFEISLDMSAAKSMAVEYTQGAVFSYGDGKKLKYR
jgi:hypothetical protein